MTPQDLHEACHEACQKCPGFLSYDDDTTFFNWPEAFGEVPNKGLHNVVRFWRENGNLLWQSGYEAELSEEVRDIFDGIDRAITQAIKDFVKTLSTKGFP